MNRPLRFLAIALTILAAGAGAYGLGRMLRPPPERVGTVLDEPQPTADLSLVAADGERVTLGEVASRSAWTVVFFGFVNCPDVCPITMARLAETYRDLGEPRDLSVVMITVDPEHDTPEVLETYVDGFHPDFRGLGGSSGDVAAAASRFFVGYNGTGTDIVHTDAVALLDDAGRLRAVYTAEKVGRIGNDLVDLLEGRAL